MRASGQFTGNLVKQSLRLEGASLGGGLLSQGGDLKVLDNTFFANEGIGVSFVNDARGEIRGNAVWQNGGTAICLYRSDKVTVKDNLIGGNLTNQTGICGERR